MIHSPFPDHFRNIFSKPSRREAVKAEFFLNPAKRPLARKPALGFGNRQPAGQVFFATVRLALEKPAEGVGRGAAGSAIGANGQRGLCNRVPLATIFPLAELCLNLGGFLASESGGLERLAVPLPGGALGLGREGFGEQVVQIGKGVGGRRGSFEKLLDAGFVDTFRQLHPTQTEAYSWWSYRMRARATNAGWRIDYFLVSQNAADRVVDASILDDVYGSDHCPVGLTIRL